MSRGIGGHLQFATKLTVPPQFAWHVTRRDRGIRDSVACHAMMSTTGGGDGVQATDV